MIHCTPACEQGDMFITARSALQLCCLTLCSFLSACSLTLLISVLSNVQGASVLSCFGKHFVPLATLSKPRAPKLMNLIPRGPIFLCIHMFLTWMTALRFLNWKCFKCELLTTLLHPQLCSFTKLWVAGWENEALSGRILTRHQAECTRWLISTMSKIRC